MSIEGFIRKRLEAWQEALGALPSDQCVCLDCGHTHPMAALVNDRTPCCGEEYFQGWKEVDQAGNEKAAFVSNGHVSG